MFFFFFALIRFYYSTPNIFQWSSSDFSQKKLFPCNSNSALCIEFFKIEQLVIQLLSFKHVTQSGSHTVMVSSLFFKMDFFVIEVCL